MKRATRIEDYEQVHDWLKRYFGAARYCENRQCKGESKRYEWSLIRGKAHKRDRSHYQELCVRCHRIYDGSLMPDTLEQPNPISPRVYKRHRQIIKKAARKLQVSHAEVVRRALDAFDF